MREIALFVEDYAHRQVIGALVQRIAEKCEIAIHLDWRNAVRGHGKVIAELNDYMRDLRRQGGPWLTTRFYRDNNERESAVSAPGKTAQNPADYPAAIPPPASLGPISKPH